MVDFLGNQKTSHVKVLGLIATALERSQNLATKLSCQIFIQNYFVNY